MERGSQAAGAGPGRRAGAGTGPSANPRQFPYRRRRYRLPSL